MSDRLANLKQSICNDPFDYFQLNSLFTPQHAVILAKVEQFGQKYLTTQQFYDHIEQAQFPDYLLPHLQELDIGKYFIPEPYGQQLPLVVQGAIIATMAQFDLGVSTFLFLQLPLSGRTLFQLGSPQQKQQYLPDLIALRKVWGWALTERQVGSNSTRLSTSYAKQGETLILNGNKRWIGNGNRDYLIVYGNLRENGKNNVVGAVVDVKAKGVTSVPIPHKTAFRIVQNCQIELKDVSLPVDALLPGATNYREGVEKVLKHSRIIVIWNAIGGCIGAYKQAIAYARSRQQFGRPIAGFQLVQQKLVRMMGNVQAVLLVGWRLTALYQTNPDLSTGTIGMFKAFVTERGRVVCALAREIMGGNGLLHQNRTMRLLADMEVLFTYEGTYDINALVAGFELTGLKAFT